MKKLLRIFEHNLVDGFKLRGRVSTSCVCDACAQAKIKRQPQKQHTEFESVAKTVGYLVSSDVKDVSYSSFGGYRYVVNFVDHASRLAFVYFLRSKNEVTQKLKQYLSDMERLGVKVQNIQTDRGSEYFEQEGESPVYSSRRKHEFVLYCESKGVHHIVQPVEMHEVLAETFWKDSFAAVDAMLWDARLSPAFWVDALDYYVYLLNRIPHDHLGGDMAPLQKVTGRRSRWDHLRTFGCDVYVHIPNNDLAKVPGVPKGKKYLFVGFSQDKNGFKVFDPERRTYHTVGNCYFYEDFSSRVDALRHHDQRRVLMRRGLEPPIILDDFQDVNSHAVRNLFIEPDAVSPTGAVQGPRDVSLGGAEGEAAPAVPDVQFGGAEAEAPREVVLSQIESLEKFLHKMSSKEQ